MVLDSEALSSIIHQGERGISRRRASAILTMALAAGSRVIVPAPILAEVGRSRDRRRAVDVAIAKLAVIATDRAIAQRAGLLLGRARLGSQAAVDAFVVATAAQHHPAVIVTGHLDDLGVLASGLANLHVQPLAG